MRREIIIFFASILFVFIFVFVVFTVQFNFTGHAVSGSSSISGAQESVSPDIFRQNVSEHERIPDNVTQDMALASLNSSWETIQDMQKDNASVQRFYDAFLEAQRIFSLASYNEILDDDHASPEAKAEAAQILSLAGTINASYHDVLERTADIGFLRSEAQHLSSFLTGMAVTLAEYSSAGIAVHEAALLSQEAQQAFAEERYEDSRELLKDAASNLESEKSKTTAARSMQQNTLLFVREYWISALVLLPFAAFLGFFLFQHLSRKNLLKKISNLKTQEHALNELIKKTQEQRYVGKNISELTYSLRMDHYRNTLNRIHQELPVFEFRLAHGKNTKKMH